MGQISSLFFLKNEKENLQAPAAARRELNFSQRQIFLTNECCAADLLIFEIETVKSQQARKGKKKFLSPFINGQSPYRTI